MIWKRSITNSHLAHSIYFNYYFLQSRYKAFYSSTSENTIDLLPKSQHLLTKSLGSESIDSQLSVAIFIALRNLLVAQNDSI